MNTTTLSSPRSAPNALLWLACALRRGGHALGRFALHLDAWLARRERARQDYELLSQMSERELRDIGLARGSVADVVRGNWTR